MTLEPRERLPLSKERIIAAALNIVDTDGLEHLSMRRLGQQLGVDPMAIYYHIPNKAALHDSLVEYLWSGVALTNLGPVQTWQEVLHTVFSGLRERLLAHPHAAVLVGTRPTTTPTMLRLIEDMLARLENAGLTGKDAMQLLDCLTGFTVGKVLSETNAQKENLTETVAAALATITPDTHPHLCQTMASGYALAPAEGFDRGLLALIQGWR